MILLSAGLALFALVHLLPALRPGLKNAVVARVGGNGYRGLFSLLVLAGAVLMVLGWRSAQPVHLFAPPAWTRPLGLALIALAFLLFVVATRRSAIRRWLRHPQLTGIILWALAHLLLNGDSRALALFAGLGLWAVLEIAAINRRDAKPPPATPPGFTGEVLTVVIAAAVFTAVGFLHPWFTGVPAW